MIKQEVKIEDVMIANPTDDVAAGPVLEILYKGAWIVAEEEVFESWTGLRRKNGEDFHGDVKYMGEGNVLWTGHRSCGCPVCQAHVEHKFKPN